MAGIPPVLVVDDTLTYREMVSAILSRRGYRVSRAANGREALERLSAAFEPHIILLDLVMPVLDGIGVLQALHTDSDMYAAGHQIIVMSSPPPPAQFETWMPLQWLAKPFTPSQLLAAVEAARNSTN